MSEEIEQLHTMVAHRDAETAVLRAQLAIAMDALQKIERASQDVLPLTDEKGKP